MDQKQEDNRLRIFLSYGHDANEELVRLIKADLEKRGHDVWFDKNEIKFGDEWRRSITDGILKSNRVLSFLSKHSTRDPGVCLDEIAIAIGAKGGNIQTILVESESEVRAPPSISHLQWLDMHDWERRRDAGECVWEPWYQTKLTEIVAVVESEVSRQFAGEIKTLEELLKPTDSDFTSDSRIRKLLEKKLVGREWLFEAVEKWRTTANRDSRLFWITGIPGTGKSAFAAHLAHEYGRGTVIAVQFCDWKKPDHRDACQIIRTLAFQVATRLPDYRKLLLTLPIMSELGQKNSAELFDGLLTNPLKLSIAGGRERYLIVIDALDEAGSEGRNELVDVLAKYAEQLPNWIGIVATSRPEFDVTTPFQALKLKPFPIEAKSDNNSTDIRSLLWLELATQLKNRRDADRLVEQILEKSEGVILYIESFCEDIHKQYLSLDRPNEFPQGLTGKFVMDFKRYFPDLEKFRKEMRPALRAIIAAREPLPVVIIQGLFKWQDEELNDFTLPLTSLFPISYAAGYKVIKPFHKSLADWLTDEIKAGQYFVSIMEGHRTLAEACWGEYKLGTNSMTQYSIRHVRAHLGKIGDTDRKTIIESDPNYVTLLHRTSPGERVMRVWISSTFRDTNHERDYLVRVVFPQIREYCELSNITFVEIDLRWGITEEQLASDQMLEIVLSEIDRCRPYFIGLIGERYGWIPDSISESTLARHAWLKRFPGSSTLEIEALHGALREDIPRSEALFYFRDPMVSAWIEAEHGLTCETGNTKDKVQLMQLKQKIHIAASQGRCSLSENYQTKEELGELVLRDLMAKIETQQPLQKFDLESGRHLVFARRQVQSYLTREGHFEQINAVIFGRRKPLLVTGEVGIGKTALLANWALQRQETHPIEIVVMHFAGNVPESTDSLHTMRRILNILQRLCYLNIDIPKVDEEIRRRFLEFVRTASEGEHIIFIIDGLESFDYHDSVMSFDWLFDLIECNCGVIVSSSDQQITNALRGVGWSEFQLSGLTITEKKELTTRFLSAYSRRLEPHQVERIASSLQTNNPLYLTTLLDELRIVGSFEQLDRMINHYLESPSLPSLLEKVLERLENDLGELFVRQSLSHIWKSAQGISEEKILEIIERVGLVVAIGDWKKLMRAARSILIETAGRYRICHPAWRSAIGNRYFGQG